MFAKAELEAAITKATRTVSYQRAERELDYVAVCLVGYREPVPLKLGSNATACPVEVVWSRDPENAAKTKDRAQPIHKMEVLCWVWTPSEAHAKRLKAALDTCLLGDDPDMRRMRNGFRDVPEWEVAWPILLQEAVEILRARGETVETFSEEMRVHRILRHARSRLAG
jgi:hypothetical protein